MYFITEVKNDENYPVNPTEIIGINTNAIVTIERGERYVNSLVFYVGGSSNYTKIFNSEQERDDYFNYLATKLEIINFIKVEGHNRDKIINFNNVIRVDKNYSGGNGFYRVSILIDGNYTDIYFENTNDADQYYDCLMGKLGAIKI